MQLSGHKSAQLKIETDNNNELHQFKYVHKNYNWGIIFPKIGTNKQMGVS